MTLTPEQAKKIIERVPPGTVYYQMAQETLKQQGQRKETK